MLLMVLALTTADPVATLLQTASDQAAKACGSAGCAPAVTRSFRIRDDVAQPYDLKAAALAITGQDCDRIGKLMCTGTTYTVFSKNY